MGPPTFSRMTSCTRRLLGPAALFAGILVLGAWPYSSRATSTLATAYCRLASWGVAHHELGRGGHIRFLPAEGARQPGDNVEADAIVALSVERFAGELPLGVSLRRDVYLPWLILTALLVAAPIQWTWRAIGSLLALPLVLGASVAAYTLLATWTFATHLRDVYVLSGPARRLMDLAYGALLVPAGNRFIAPLGLGALAVAWGMRRQGSRGRPRASVVAAPSSQTDPTPIRTGIRAEPVTPPARDPRRGAENGGHAS